METNRRSADRLKSLGLLADIFDGRVAALGLVDDVSHAGIRVSTIPDTFNDGVETCFAVVNSGERDIHLALHPRWVMTTAKGTFKTIGFQIKNPSEEWDRSLREMELMQGEGIELAA